MNGGALDSVGRACLGTGDFEALRRIIHAHTGIALNDSKRALVEARLARRLRARDLPDFHAYVRLLDGAAATDDELRAMVNCITTNKTSFFREPHHFELLESTIVPELVERARRTGSRRIRIWSAGCSTGEEPYSIAMALRSALGSLAGWDVRILASDIDTEVLARAEAGVYEPHDAEGVPAWLRRDSFDVLRDGRLSIVRPLRDLITFRRINLIERPWPIRTRFDVVFCRNVVIYFDRETQRDLYGGIAEVLEDDGYLVAGHSENLHWAPQLFRSAGGTVYRHSRGKPARIAAPAPPLPPPPPLPPSPRAMPEVSIHVGGVHASATPTRIRTVLGSCVAACLFDPDAGVGGMNHFMLPDGSREALPTRFGIHAMEVLINALLKLGAQRHRLVAKIFGAGNPLANLQGEGSVARRNADFIESFLADEGIPILARKLGGPTALSLQFETATGRALVRTVSASQNAHVARLEQQRDSALDADPAAAVTFFSGPTTGQEHHPAGG